MMLWGRKWKRTLTWTYSEREILRCIAADAEMAPIRLAVASQESKICEVYRYRQNGGYRARFIYSLGVQQFSDAEDFLLAELVGDTDIEQIRSQRMG